MPKEPGRLVSLNSPRRGGQVPEPGVDDLRFWEREGDGGWLTAGDPYVKEDGPMAAMLAQGNVQGGSGQQLNLQFPVGLQEA